jgi:hypothetical protein
MACGVTLTTPELSLVGRILALARLLCGESDRALDCHAAVAILGLQHPHWDALERDALQHAGFAGGIGI